MTAPEYIGDGVVLRYGELFLKGKNRHLFEKALERNVRRVVAGAEGVEVVRGHGRIFVLGDSASDLTDRLARVFGISSVSPAVFCEKSMEEIRRVALVLAEEPPPGASTFRISPRRADKGFVHKSSEIGRVVGADVAVATGLGVDLEDYDFNIGVEVGLDWTFLWSSQLKGAGGLPVGTGGRGMLLLSGGIDSPVAGHMMQKRGLELEAVYFHSFPYTGDGTKDKVVALARLLAARQGGLKLHVVPFAALQERFRDGAEAKNLVLLYRRAMVRISEALARRHRIGALVTGESLGQVASQTLPNMAVIEDAATLPMLRPLVAFDKIETIELAKKIDSYDISIQPHDDCCSLFVPKHPETKGSVRHIRDAEFACDIEAHLTEAIEKTETIEL